MIAELIPKVAAEGQEKSGKYRPSPSNAGPERCLRSLAYHALEFPPAPFPGRALLTLDDSSWHEELSADWVNKTVYELHSRQMVVEIQNAFPWMAGQKGWCWVCTRKNKGEWVSYSAESLHGHIDGIVKELTTGIERLYEHKALSHFSFNRIWEQQEWPADYLTQSVLYLFGLKLYLPNINELVLVVKNKNTAQYLDLLCRYDFDKDVLMLLEVSHSNGAKYQPNIEFPNLYKETIEKFRLVEEYRQKRTLPARPFAYGTEFPCGYCRWGKTCWEGYKDEFERQGAGEITDPAVIELASRYTQIVTTEGNLRDEKDKVKDALRAQMEQLGYKEGVAGSYRIKRSIAERSTINKELIPPDVLKAASSVSVSESIRVTAIKNGKKESESHV